MTRTLILAAAGMLVTTVVWAQAPSVSPPPGSDAMSRGDSRFSERMRDRDDDDDDDRRDMSRRWHRGGWGHHRGWGPHGRMMGPGPAALFRFQRGDARFAVKCADRDTTRECVEATIMLLDKLGAMRPAP